MIHQICRLQLSYVWWTAELAHRGAQPCISRTLYTLAIDWEIHNISVMMPWSSISDAALWKLKLSNGTGMLCNLFGHNPKVNRTIIRVLRTYTHTYDFDPNDQYHDILPQDCYSIYSSAEIIFMSRHLRCALTWPEACRQGMFKRCQLGCVESNYPRFTPWLCFSCWIFLNGKSLRWHFTGATQAWCLSVPMSSGLLVAAEILLQYSVYVLSRTCW